MSLSKDAQEVACSLIACKMQNVGLERKESYTEDILLGSSELGTFLKSLQISCSMNTIVERKIYKHQVKV